MFPAVKDLQRYLPGCCSRLLNYLIFIKMFCLTDLSDSPPTSLNRCNKEVKYFLWWRFDEIILKKFTEEYNILKKLLNETVKWVFEYWRRCWFNNYNSFFYEEAKYLLFLLVISQLSLLILHWKNRYTRYISWQQ